MNVKQNNTIYQECRWDVSVSLFVFCRFYASIDEMDIFLYIDLQNFLNVSCKIRLVNWRVLILEI